MSFGSPLLLAWLVFMYYRFVDDWLTSLSPTGKGLAAMTVVLVVGLCVGVSVALQQLLLKQPAPHCEVVPADLPCATSAVANASDCPQPPVFERLVSETPNQSFLLMPMATRRIEHIDAPSPPSTGSSSAIPSQQSFGSIVMSSEESWQLSVDSQSDGDQSSHDGSSRSSSFSSFSAATDSRDPSLDPADRNDDVEHCVYIASLS